MAIPFGAILALFAGGALLAKSRSAGRSPDTLCRVPGRDFLKEGRRVMAVDVKDGSNLAPGRVLHWDGSEATAGTIRIRWASDGPWGNDCSEYKFRMKPLAWEDLNQKVITVDTSQMFSGDPWGTGGIPMLMTQEAPVLTALPRVALYPALAAAPYASHTLEETRSFTRNWQRSWIEAEVSLPHLQAGEEWSTVDGGDGLINVRGSNKEALQSFPVSNYYGQLARVGPKWVVRGPAVLALLRPDAQGRRKALSLGAKALTSMVIDPGSSDVLFVGPEFLTQARIDSALSNPQFLSTLAARRPGKAPRPIDVWLWLTYVAAHPLAETTASIPYVPGPGVYSDAIGNENPEAWIELYDDKSGFAAAWERFDPDVFAAMGVSDQFIW